MWKKQWWQITEAVVTNHPSCMVVKKLEELTLPQGGYRIGLKYSNGVVSEPKQHEGKKIEVVIKNRAHLTCATIMRHNLAK